MKIGNLPQATVLNDEDVLPVVQEGKTKKIPAKKFFEKNSGQDVEKLVSNMQVGVLIGSSGTKKELTYTQDGAKCTIHFFGKLVFRVKGVPTSGLDWNTISAGIATYVKISGETADITLPDYNRCLVYNVVTGQLEIKTYTDITINDIVLIINGYGAPCGGELMRYIDSIGVSQKEEVCVTQSGVYLTGANPVIKYSSYGSNGGIDIKLSSDLRIYYGDTYYSRNWANGVSEDFIVYADSIATITIPEYGDKFVFNIQDKALHVRKRKEANVVGDIILIANGYAVPCGGALLRYVNTSTSDDSDETKKENLIVAQSGLYIGNASFDYAVTWEQVPKSDTLKITIPELIKFRVSDLSLDMKNWTDHSSNLSGLISIDGNMATITISGFGKRLVFNINDKQLYIRERQDNIVNDIVLIINGYGTPCGGELMRYIDLGRIMNLEDSVEKMKNSFSSIEENTRNKVMEYSALFNNTDKVEPFLFFTDPHLTQSPGDDWRSEFNTYMSSLANTYNEAPVERVFCGGDWLGEREYDSEACYRLGLIDSTMRKFFKKYHLIVGNHDTNYQGCDDGLEQIKDNRYTTKLTNDTIKNLWARNTGKLYYKVKSYQTDFYVLDTNAPKNDTEGIWDTNYLNEQYKWFANELKNNKRGNLAVMVHIFLDFKYKNDDGSYDTSRPSVQGCSQPIEDIVSAFNTRSSVEVDGETFDFSTVTTGVIRFIMCGHKHVDCVTTKFASNTPVIATTHTRDGNIPTYDLCLADYTNNILKLVRVGTGLNREIPILDFGNDTTDLSSGDSGVSTETLNQIEAQLDEIIETQNSYIGGKLNNGYC